MKKYGNNGVMEMWSNFNDDDSAVAVAFVYFVREVSWTFKQYDKQVMTVIVFLQLVVYYRKIHFSFRSLIWLHDDKRIWIHIQVVRCRDFNFLFIFYFQRISSALIEFLITYDWFRQKLILMKMYNSFFWIRI